MVTVARCELPAEQRKLFEHQTRPCGMQTARRRHADGTQTARRGRHHGAGHPAGRRDLHVLPKNLGSLVEPGRSIMGVGLAKSIVSVTSPVCGVVLEDKPLLE
jgi:hypothetical protein